MFAHKTHESFEIEMSDGGGHASENFASIRVIRGPTLKLASVIGNGLSHVKGGCVAAHIVRPHFAFGDDARDG